MVAASVVAVLDNGLESTAITEYAGPFWSGRSLGLQNTYQRLMAAGAPPAFGVLITDQVIRRLSRSAGCSRYWRCRSCRPARCRPAWRLERGRNPFADFGGG